MIHAGFELGLARLQFGKRQARALAAAPPPETSPPLDEPQNALVDRVAFAIPRVASRLPWRADCLVQALAAERWLRRGGIETRLTLGVPRNKPVVFEAHAWLSAGGRIVTGGDVSDFVPLAKR
jgi:hypothetical protein